LGLNKDQPKKGEKRQEEERESEKRSRLDVGFIKEARVVVHNFEYTHFVENNDL